MNTLERSSEVGITPSFIFTLSEIRAKAGQLRNALDSRTILLYSLKACNIAEIVSFIGAQGYGCSTSSVYEAQLARATNPGAYGQYISPAISEREVDLLGSLCDGITFNSVSQYSRFANALTNVLGIRVNPEISVVGDIRYDPCRLHSKLGSTLEEFRVAWKHGLLKKISGIHVHNACVCESWGPLLKTVLGIERAIGPILRDLDWINLGGGYMWDDATDFGPLQEAVDLLAMRYGLKVFIEPGSGIINSAGCLVSSVVDVFRKGEREIAVLDTSINHLPEVFEYQFEPDVSEHVDSAPHEYILAGCSCLPGDIFGEYSFNERLQVGSRITFQNAGAYSVVKANMFNGINLPSIYALDEDGELRLLKEFTFEDFAEHVGFGLKHYANF